MCEFRHRILREIPLENDACGYDEFCIAMAQLTEIFPQVVTQPDEEEKYSQNSMMPAKDLFSIGKINR